MMRIGLRAWSAAVFGVVATFSSSGAAAQNGGVTTLSDAVLKVCLYVDIPPVAKLGEDGTWTGWDVAFLSGFAESLGLEFEPVAFDYFDGIWNKPGDGVCDITGSGLTYTDERVRATPDAIWSDAYFTAQRSFIVRDGEQDNLNGVTDLADQTVIVWPNSAGEVDLQRRIVNAAVAGVRIKHAAAPLESLEMVRDGDAFAFGWDLTNTRFLVAQYPGLAIAWIHPMMSADGSERSETYSYVVRKADTGLVDALNAYIAENRSNYGWPR